MNNHSLRAASPAVIRGVAYSLMLGICHLRWEAIEAAHFIYFQFCSGI